MHKFKKYSTAIVLSHLAVAIVHGLAHERLAIHLTSVQKLFIMVMVIVAPLVAMSLSWTRHWKVAGTLLFLSMSGSLIFGVANHFLIVSADHVSHLPAGQWVLPFQVTAVLLALTESVGCLVGLAALLAKDRA